MRHMWGMTELAPIGTVAGPKVGCRFCSLLCLLLLVLFGNLRRALWSGVCGSGSGSLSFSSASACAGHPPRDDQGTEAGSASEAGVNFGCHPLNIRGLKSVTAAFLLSAVHCSPSLQRGLRRLSTRALLHACRGGRRRLWTCASWTTSARSCRTTAGRTGTCKCGGRTSCRTTSGYTPSLIPLEFFCGAAV